MMSSELPEYSAPVEPPFYGTGPLITWEPGALLGAVDRNRLLQSIPGDPETKELEPVLDAMITGIERDRLFEPAGLYGYFPVITDDDLVIILDPADFFTERVTLRFPRMPRKGGLSMADYLRPEGDVVGIQIVTIGKGMAGQNIVSGTSPGCVDTGSLSERLANHLIEDLAGRLTREITKGLMLSPGWGLLANFGSPDTPVFEEQRELFDFLAIEERLGISLVPRQNMVSGYWRSGIFFHK